MKTFGTNADGLRRTMLIVDDKSSAILTGIRSFGGRISRRIERKTNGGSILFWVANANKMFVDETIEIEIFLTKPMKTFEEFDSAMLFEKMLSNRFASIFLLDDKMKILFRPKISMEKKKEKVRVGIFEKNKMKRRRTKNLDSILIDVEFFENGGKMRRSKSVEILNEMENKSAVTFQPTFEGNFDFRSIFLVETGRRSAMRFFLEKTPLSERTDRTKTLKFVETNRIGRTFAAKRNVAKFSAPTGITKTKISFDVRKFDESTVFAALNSFRCAARRKKNFHGKRRNREKNEIHRQR